MEKESPEMDQIRAAVREAGVFVVLGYSERYKGTLYIAQVSRISSTQSLYYVLTPAVLH